MKIVLCVLLLICLITTTALAETYVLSLNCLGDYGTPQTISVDFGQSFSSVQSVSIAWSGQITPGGVLADPDGIVGPSPVPGWFTAGFLVDDEFPVEEAVTPALGGMTYPGPESFNLTSVFNPIDNHQGWDFLLDGRADLLVQVASDNIVLFYPGWGATGSLGSASLILDATPVPESGALFTMLSGIFGSTLYAYRRRKS
jgi:hypothetical protein